MPGPDQERYTGLLSIKDPTQRRVLKSMMDRLNMLEGQITTIMSGVPPLSTALDAANQRLMTVADPAAEGDAVNFRTLKRYVESAIALSRNPVPAHSGQPGGGPDSPPMDDNGEGAAGLAAAGGTGHVAPGSPLSLFTAGQIVGGTANEFPTLVAVAADQPTRDANALQLLERMIWHLQLAGFSAARQRNPSGVISQDKLTVQVSMVWWAYDVFQGVPFTVAIPVQMVVVSPPDPSASSGIPD